MMATDLLGPVVVHSGDNIRYANEEFCRLLGVDSQSELSGRPLREFVAPRYHNRLRAQFEQLTTEAVPTLGVSLELDGIDRKQTEVIAVSSLVEWDRARQIQTSFIDVSTSDNSIAVSVRKSALQQAPVGITIADARREDEPLIYVNDSFVELTGYPREEILGKNCRFLQGDATRDKPVGKMRAAIESEEPVTVELRNYRKDGTMFWNRVTISPIRDETGDVTHFFGFQEDISETKIYEHEKTLFEKHATASDQMMFITDSDGTIEYVNPAFERISGYSSGEAVGNTPSILNSGQQDESFYQELWEKVEAGEVWEQELTNQTKSGELYEVHQTIVPVTDDRGEVTHFTAIERDISGKQLREEVLDVLERVLRHNVRTSINIIDGYTAHLETDPDRSERQAATRAIRKQTTALRSISEQLTAIRKMVHGISDPSPLDLSHIEEIVAQSRVTNDDATIDLTIDTESDATIQNGSVFQVALEAGIENLIDHNDRENPTVEITVRQSDDSDVAVVEIADDGPGIPDTQWEIVEAGIETPLEHTSGIGLWIVYWSVTALGGTVEKDDNDPRGTTLTLEVPVIQNHGSARETP